MLPAAAATAADTFECLFIQVCGVAVARAALIAAAVAAATASSTTSSVPARAARFLISGCRQPPGNANAFRDDAV